MSIIIMIESFILFDNEDYRHHDGAAMGSPLEPNFIRASLCEHEFIWPKKCLSEFKLITYKRYVVRFCRRIRHDSFHQNGIFLS